MICAVWATQKNHDSWDFALINQQPFSLMWYFILKLRRNNSYPKILSRNVPPQKNVLAINHPRTTLNQRFFCVDISVRRLRAKVKMICCQHGREFQKAWAYAMPMAFGYCKKQWNHKVWMMIKMLIGKYMNMEYHGISYRLYRNMMIV